MGNGQHARYAWQSPYEQKVALMLEIAPSMGCGHLCLMRQDRGALTAGRLMGQGECWDTHAVGQPGLQASPWRTARRSRVTGSHLEQLLGTAAHESGHAARWQVGAKVVLGDRPVRVTLARSWAALGRWERVRFLWTLLRSGLLRA